MSLTSKRFLIAAAAAILSLGTVGCHGQYPGGSGYMPAATTALPPSQAGGITPLGKKGKIESGCGKRIHIVVAGILDCRFHEANRKDTTFTIVNDESGIVEVSPSSGNQSTTFTIVGLVAGSGYILVKDSKGDKYKMRITVTL